MGAVGAAVLFIVLIAGEHLPFVIIRFPPTLVALALELTRSLRLTCSQRQATEDSGKDEESTSDLHLKRAGRGFHGRRKCERIVVLVSWVSSRRGDPVKHFRTADSIENCKPK